MKPCNHDQALQVEPDAAAGFYRVRLQPDLEGRQLTIVDEALGIAAWVGTTPDFRAEIDMLVFTPPKDKANPEWTDALVRSWLNGNGFSDHAQDATGNRHSHDHFQLDGKANVRDDGDDWWVIEGNVIAQTGAYNRILRPAEAYDTSWRLFDGVPVTHPHPPGLVEDLDLVGGIVRNVRYEKVSDALHGGHRIRADYYLAKRSMSGLKVRDNIIALNKETVRRVRAGIPVDNSQGYTWRGRERTDRDPSPQDAGQDYDYVMAEQVPNHLAILLEQEGACPWRRGCGAGRLAPDVAGDASRRILKAVARQERKAQTLREAVRHGEGPMPHDDATCPHAPRLQTVEGDLQKAKDAARALDHMHAGLADVGKLLGLKTDGLTCDAVKAALQPKLDRLAKFEAAEKAQRDSLVKETVTLALKVDKKADKAALEAAYADTPLPVLAQQRDTLQALVTIDERGRKGSRDPGRFAAGDEGAEDEKPRRTVGVPTRDAAGNRVWK